MTTPSQPADPAGAAVVAETHVSVVVMIGDRAYKLLKPVDLGFLDHRRREDRERACGRETEANRRFAPDVYLGVLDVVDGEGRAVDHLIAMRRMPAERRLSELLDAPEATARVEEVARALVAAHARAPAGPRIDAAATRDAVRGDWEQGLAQVAEFVPRVIPSVEHEEVAALAREYLEGRAPLFDDRIRRGCARDGHGDLLAEDVYCLADGPRMLDCLAFDDRLRHGDVLADVAFLAMDLEARGHPELAALLLRRAAARPARPPLSLAHHYVAYRAHVRAKVACLRHRQGDPAAGEVARARQRLALAHLRAGRVRLVLVGGAPGAGKSSVAAALAERAGWTVLRSDVLRKELAGAPAHARAPAPLWEGLYAPAVTARVYAELVRRARRLLQMGESVVLDASWSGAASREDARAAARDARAALSELRVVAPAAVAAERVRARAAAGGDPSDAGPQVARALAASADAWPEAREVDGSRPRAEVAEAAAALAEADPGPWGPPQALGWGGGPPHISA